MFAVAIMKYTKWMILLGVSLAILSAVLYCLQIAVFNDPRSTMFYLMQDIAFIPLQILVVTIIIDQLLRNRQQQILLKKMNMVIGAFFSECGSELIRSYFKFERNSDEIRGKLQADLKWTDKDYDAVKKSVKDLNYDIDCRVSEINSLKSFLIEKKSFLLRLLENPNLLEHDSFTDLLWAVFHLAEELEFRADLNHLTRPDSDHISLDMKRAFSLLIYEWLSYMKHLKNEYPYLYSLSVRMNPFNKTASAEIK